MPFIVLLLTLPVLCYSAVSAVVQFKSNRRYMAFFGGLVCFYLIAYIVKVFENGSD